MKTKILLSLLSLIAVLPLAQAQKPNLAPPRPPESSPLPAPPPVWVDTNYQPPAWSAARPETQPAYVYDQKPLAGGRIALISPDQAQGIIDRFKAAYPKLGSPRLLIYVNRELVDGKGGLKITHGNQHVESRKSFGAGANDSSSIKTTTDQSFRATEKSEPTLADKQTVRDVERLFGRPLRQAGAGLADQRVAAALIADKPISEFIGTTDSPDSRKDREAIGKIADAVIEILISSKTVTVARISGEQTISLPDIQATAIRLSDSKILGQASSSDVTNRVPPASLAGYGTPEITEATALALMEDMTPAP